jgi:hypothetical protein
VELHSEQETFRATLTGRTPENEYATLIITRRHQRIWITFNGAIKTTLTLSDPDTTQLVGLLQAAQGAPHSPQADSH